MLFFFAVLKHNIRNFFFLGLFAIMFAGSCAQSTHNARINYGPIPQDQAHLENLMSATVGFVVDNEGKVGSPPFCSGFFVNNSMIVSTAHCFRESIRLELNGRTVTLRSPADIVGQRVTFIFKNEYDESDSLTEVDVHSGIIVKTDFEHDIVAILANTDNPSFIPVASTIPAIGARVYGIGHPSGMGWTFSEGIVSRTLVRGNRLLVVQATTLLAGGCSGGPLLNDRGELIGVADAFVNNLPHLGIFIGNHFVRTISHEDTNNSSTASRAPTGRRQVRSAQY